MSIMLDEAQAYENSRDYDCCQIIEGACTVGDAIYEAYCAGREAPPTDTEITAAAKYLKANPGLFGLRMLHRPEPFRRDRERRAPSSQNCHAGSLNELIALPCYEHRFLASKAPGERDALGHERKEDFLIAF